MSEQSDLVAAALIARDVLRRVAQERAKIGPLSTSAQQAVHQLNAALAPFSEPPKSAQPQVDVRDVVSKLKD